ncbi:MAG: FAD-dependent oxidoreductase, partial [Candidatus Nitrosopelagicus sp.]|nr:FAD-dependent oxidoreductase [Candidatus Nitrosopelagicus sp.]
IHRRNEFRASKIMQERALNNDKIIIHWNSIVSDIKGDQKVEQVVLKNTETGEETDVDMAGVFVAIGHEPNTHLFNNKLELDENGYIVLENGTETSVNGIFSAGDVHDHRYRQAVTAAGYGCMAAIDVDKYLSEQK